VTERSSLAQRELLERETELATVEGLVGGISGGGRLLAIEGPPGIGKTALIGETKALAQEAGWQVLSARGSEFERSFSYGLVRQLFEPLLAFLPAEERAELLVGAAALSAPLFDPAELEGEPAVDSSWADLHGLYWLTANVAMRRSLLIAIDDLHWCDLPSLRWLAYLLPRMEGLDLSIVVGLRPREPGEDSSLLGQIVSDPLATVIRPAPLSEEAAAALVRETLTPIAEDAFCTACWKETGGNPLLLRELVRAVGVEGLIPVEANVPRLHELEARAGSRPVSLRLSTLPQEATVLAQAVAILGDDADLRQTAELAELDEPSASEAAAALARVDVLRPDQPLGFVHPRRRARTSGTPPCRRRSRARAGRRALAAQSSRRRPAGRHDLARSCPPCGHTRRLRKRCRLSPPRAR
jgi:predicted ATPase